MAHQAPPAPARDSSRPGAQVRRAAAAPAARPGAGDRGGLPSAGNGQRHSAQLPHSRVRTARPAATCVLPADRSSRATPPPGTACSTRSSSSATRCAPRAPASTHLRSAALRRRQQPSLFTPGGCCTPLLCGAGGAAGRGHGAGRGSARGRRRAALGPGQQPVPPPHAGPQASLRPGLLAFPQGVVRRGLADGRCDARPALGCSCVRRVRRSVVPVLLQQGQPLDEASRAARDASLRALGLLAAEACAAYYSR